jgi:hypothetical protein
MMPTKYITLVPAYGRDYKSAKEVMADWKEGKDFQICDFSHPDDGRYTSIRDWDNEHSTVLNIRYKRLTQITPIKVGK